mmetsp:Transcript_23574/g.56368  ORF Transcript_23574/g.56368 Transcript_23574/m.56368 type:complete len:388 (-) Transcript_23574:297-1460(-)
MLQPLLGEVAELLHRLRVIHAAVPARGLPKGSDGVRLGAEEHLANGPAGAGRVALLEGGDLLCLGDERRRALREPLHCIRRRDPLERPREVPWEARNPPWLPVGAYGDRLLSRQSAERAAGEGRVDALGGLFPREQILDDAEELLPLHDTVGVLELLDDELGPHVLHALLHDRRQGGGDGGLPRPAEVLERGLHVEEPRGHRVLVGAAGELLGDPAVRHGEREAAVRVLQGPRHGAFRGLRLEPHHLLEEAQLSQDEEEALGAARSDRDLVRSLRGAAAQQSVPGLKEDLAATRPCLGTEGRLLGAVELAEGGQDLFWVYVLVVDADAKQLRPSHRNVNDTPITGRCGGKNGRERAKRGQLAFVTKTTRRHCFRVYVGPQPIAAETP